MSGGCFCAFIYQIIDLWTVILNEARVSYFVSIKFDTFNDVIMRWSLFRIKFHNWTLTILANSFISYLLIQDIRRIKLNDTLLKNGER